jgi:hypothetical protein
MSREFEADAVIALCGGFSAPGNPGPAEAAGPAAGVVVGPAFGRPSA